MQGRRRFYAIWRLFGGAAEGDPHAQLVMMPDGLVMMPEGLLALSFGPPDRVLVSESGHYILAGDNYIVIPDHVEM